MKVSDAESVPSIYSRDTSKEKGVKKMVEGYTRNRLSGLSVGPKPFIIQLRSYPYMSRWGLVIQHFFYHKFYYCFQSCIIFDSMLARRIKIHKEILLQLQEKLLFVLDENKKKPMNCRALLLGLYFLLIFVWTDIKKWI